MTIPLTVIVFLALTASNSMTLSAAENGVEQQAQVTAGISKPTEQTDSLTDKAHHSVA